MTSDDWSSTLVDTPVDNPRVTLEKWGVKNAGVDMPNESKSQAFVIPQRTMPIHVPFAGAPENALAIRLHVGSGGDVDIWCESSATAAESPSTRTPIVGKYRGNP